MVEVNLPPTGIGITGVLPLFFSKATSDIRTFFEGVLSGLDPHIWSKLEKQDGRQKSLYQIYEHIFGKNRGTSLN